MKKLLSMLLVLSLVFSALLTATPIVSAAESTDPWAIQVCRKGSAGGSAFDYSSFDWSTFGENLIPDPTVAHFDENGVYGKYAVPTDPENGEWAPSNVNPYYWWDKYIQQYHGFEMYYQDMADNGVRDGNVNGTSYSYVLRSPANYADGVTIGKYPSLTDDGSGVLRRKSGGGMQYYSLPTLEANSYYVVKLNLKSSGEIANGNLDICLPKPNNFSPEVSAANASASIYLQDFAINKVKTAAFVVYTGSKTYTEAFIGAYVTTELFFDDFGVYKVTEDYANSCSAGTMLQEVVNEADIEWAIQTSRDSSGARISYKGFDWNAYGKNLVPDPTVSHFEGGVYGEYATPDENWKPTNINPYYWWDKYIEESYGFTMYKQDMVDGTLNKMVGSTSYTNGFQSPKSRSMPKTSGSLTNDGTGVLQTSSGGGARAVPLPAMEAYKYYVIKFNIKCASAMTAGVDLCLVPNKAENNLIKNDDIASSVNIGSGYADNKVETISYVVYTGKNTYNDPFIKIFCNGSIATYLDDFGVYEVTEEYAIQCSNGAKLPEIQGAPDEPDEPDVTDEWSAVQSMYTGSIWNDTFAWRDISGVYFDSFGKNLITDPTVNNFAYGEYLEYYDWESRDAGTVINANAWWDKPVITYNGFEMDVVQNRYTSARYSGYVLNDDTLSHTADGSGVIKIGDTRKSLFLPLARMEKYSYYALTFWLKASDANFDGNIVIYDKADGNVLLDINQARLVQIKGNNKWVQYAAVIYTGNNVWGQPAIKLPGSKSTTYYFDDFGMYELDKEYGLSCIEAGYLLPHYVDYDGSNKGICLSTQNYEYIRGYENVDWSKYGVNIFADSTVSRFADDDNYADYATNSLAILDKPIADIEGSLYKSLNDRGFVTSDTSYSHTADGSGAIHIPVSASGKAIQAYIGLPSFQKYTFYAVTMWVRNPHGSYSDINLRCVAHDTLFTTPGATFKTGYGLEESNDYWQRVTFLIYTSGANSYYLNMPYIQVNIEDVTIDEIEVWKLDDESFAKECLDANKLIIENDIDGSVSVDAGDIACLMKELLLSTANLKEVYDINKDGTVDVRDIVKFKGIIAGVKDLYEYCDSEMLGASVLYTGDTQRLSYKIKQALADKDKNTTIAVLGDSITYGAGATNDARHYSTKFKNWWRDNISESVSLVRRGSGATTSYLGVHWAEEAILPHNPDIIFIEYVNDTNDSGTLQAMDSLVRKCLALESKPAVILLEMSYYGTKGEGVLSNAQETHIRVAEAYGVPVISWRDAIEVALNNGKYKWTDLSADEVHPNNTGNAMLAEMMVYFTSKYVGASGDAQEPDVFNTPAITVDKYKNATIKARGEVTVIDEGSFTETVTFAGEKYNVFEDGWSTTTGGSITFKLTFKNLGMVCQRTSDDLNGKVEIKVDGNKVATIDGDNAAGWGTFNHAQEIITFDEEAEHTVTVTVMDSNTRKAFQIVGWLVS